MIPRAIMQIDKIPLNQNSKVNKKALPPIALSKEEVILPHNEREKKIFEAAKAVLGDTGFGIKEDLFSFGLSSIGLMKFLTLLEDDLQEDFSTKEIKKAKTIEEIARISHAFSKLDTIQKDYPLTKTQEGIYVESLAHPSSTIYNVPLLEKLDKKIRLEKLKTSIIKAINNHPYLKSKLVLGLSG